MIARLVIAGTHSGVGKTTLTAGLIAALRQRGLTVQPFKTGPDYIDPTYHTLAAGQPCRNLDTWMVPPERIQALFVRASAKADLALIEGVMGIYDGFGYDDETGSTAQVAKLLSAPVVLVIDARSMARSAAAIALGYQRFDRKLPLAGFIINRVGSAGHGEGVARAIQRATHLPVFGWLPRDPALEIPERHLGLVPTAEPGRWQAFLEAAAERVSRYLDVDGLLALAQQVCTPDNVQELTFEGQIPARIGSHPPVIAVAQDEAFSFTYPDNLDLLQVAGAELVPFSPVRDPAIPETATGVILSGGFPELYAAQLSANASMRESLRETHRRGLPIYAECGGLMYLTQTISDLEGQEHQMTGLLPGRSVMSRRLTLGYRLARAAGDSWLFSAGERVRGHEFHYSSWEGRPANLTPAYHLLPADGQGEPYPEGACLGNLWASYVHLHFWNRPSLALRFVAACRAGVRRRASR
jgi:cobyrinic acid a,c-diamide synthase